MRIDGSCWCPRHGVSGHDGRESRYGVSGHNDLRIVFARSAVRQLRGLSACNTMVDPLRPN